MLLRKTTTHENSTYIKSVYPFTGQVENSKNRKSRKTQKFFSKIFKFNFSILAIGQNRKVGNKKTRNIISEISEISELSEFQICHFFIFQKAIFFFNILQWAIPYFLSLFFFFSKPFEVFFPSPKIYFQNITLS